MATRRNTWGRREFLGGMAGTVGLLGHERRAGAEPPPETTRLRLRRIRDTICVAPQYVAEDLLRAEGFTDVQYLTFDEAGAVPEALARGRVDLSVNVFLGGSA